MRTVIAGAALRPVSACGGAFAEHCAGNHPSRWPGEGSVLPRLRRRFRRSARIWDCALIKRRTSHPARVRAAFVVITLHLGEPLIVASFRELFRLLPLRGQFGSTRNQLTPIALGIRAA
jgi:hypothetical protein